MDYLLECSIYIPVNSISLRKCALTNIKHFAILDKMIFL